MEELVPESEVISDGALLVTFKKITGGMQLQWPCWLQLLLSGLEKEVIPHSFPLISENHRVTQ